MRLQNVWGAKPELLAEIALIESALPGIGPVPTLAASHVPEPDLKSAERLTFDLTAGHVSPALEAYLKDNPNVTLDQLCLPQRTFWAINGKSWSGQDHKLKPPPLAELKRGTLLCVRAVQRHAAPAPDPSARPYLPRAQIQQGGDRPASRRYRADRAQGTG